MTNIIQLRTVSLDDSLVAQTIECPFCKEPAEVDASVELESRPGARLRRLASGCEHAGSSGTLFEGKRMNGGWIFTITFESSHEE